MLLELGKGVRCAEMCMLREHGFWKTARVWTRRTQSRCIGAGVQAPITQQCSHLKGHKESRIGFIGHEACLQALGSPVRKKNII